ncbi:MAG: metal-dependent hydrolase [Deltaproteobacteria bacterium]|nr:metal-dependent hydrolase [Deltaproteobacteria bacterium]
MPTALTHAVLGAGAAAVFALRMRRVKPCTVLGLGAIAGASPDIDFVSFITGIPYEHALGHRGITHSVAATVAVAALIAAVVHARSRTHRVDRPFRPIGRDAVWLWAGLTVAGVVHALADMLTDGGLGIAIFAPFSWKRYFLPVTPIPVSPLWLSAETARVIGWEVLHLWPPAAAAIAIVFILRRRCETGH